MTRFTYLDANGVVQGPVNEQQLKDLATQGIINPHTQLAADTGHRGVAGQIPGLFTAPAPPPPPVQRPISTQVSPGVEQRKKRIVFWTMCCLGTYAIPLSLQMIVSLLMLTAPGEQILTMNAIVNFINTPIATLYLCCYFFYLRRLWEEIPGKFARTTPGMAAGLALVPVFNLYWQFVAFWGLYQDMNKTTEAYRLGSRFDTTLIRIVCIAWIALFVIGVLGWGVSVAASANDIQAAVASGQPAVPGMVMPRTGMLIFGIILQFVNAAVTISAYWITHKKVLEFIDIKSSVGR